MGDCSRFSKCCKHFLVGVSLILVVSGCANKSGAERFAAVVPIEFVISAPVHLSYRLPWIDVYIKGRGPFRFLLETRDRPCALRRDLADQLGLDPEDNAVAMRVGRMNLGAVSYEIREFASRIPGSETARGVLSLSAFRSHPVTVDFANKVVRFAPRGNENLPEKGAVHYSVDSMGFPSVPVRIAGQRMSAALDIWRSGDLMVPDNLATDLPFLETPVVSGHVRWGDEIFRVRSNRLDGFVEFAGHSVARPGVHVSGGFPALTIGQGVLRSYAVTFDQRRRLVWFEESEMDGKRQSVRPPVPIGDAPIDLVGNFDANRGKVRLLLLLSPT